MKKLYFILKFFLVSVLVFSQNHSEVDSLKVLIQSEKDVNKKTNYLYQLGDLFEHSNHDSALYYYESARDFAQENNFKLGEAKFASHAITILNAHGDFSEALELTQEALQKYKEVNIPKEIAIAYINLGKQWRMLSDFEQASENYMLAKKIADSIADKTTQRTINNNLAAIFIDMKQYEKAEPYGLEALKLGIESGNQVHQLSPLYNLSMLYFYNRNYNQALRYINDFEKIAKEGNDDYDRVDAMIAKGLILGKLNPDQAILYLNQGISSAKAFDFPHSEMYAYLYLGEIYIERNQFSKALENLMKGISIAENLGMKYELADFHEKASQAYENSGNFENALQHIRKHEKLSQEIQLEENKNRMIALEAKYSFEAKEAEIKSLKAQKEAQTLKIQKKNSLNIMLIALLLLAGIMGVFIYKNHKNKQKIQAQRIHELETEKQLYATQALLQGQENERSRMAKELHDGLGGLLSGVKLNLNYMQKKLIITEEDGAAFEKSIHLLDQSINELRRVAHNLMPESILKFGLDGAINEFLQSIKNENLNIVYQSYHIEKGVGKQLDISIYRIIQELVNNAIKHSYAKDILVQLRKDENLVILEVEDNGLGFEMDTIQKENGMGLAGIRSRVAYWKGKTAIDSSKNEGTSIHIEIPI